MDRQKRPFQRTGGATLAQQRFAFVDQNACQPGGKIGFLPQRVAFLPGPEQRILNRVLRIGAAGGVKEAIHMAREYAPFVRKIEIEVENLDMVKEALEAGADIIMLDNMSVEDMKEAVKLTKGKAETECSGNVTKENIARLVDIGVDYISSGALTHSAPILDLSLKNLHTV